MSVRYVDLSQRLQSDRLCVLEKLGNIRKIKKSGIPLFIVFLIMTDSEKIAKTIWGNSLQKSRKFFGWLPNLKSIKVIKNGTTFYLGKLKAWVSIEYQKSLNNYSVSIKPEDGGNEIVYHSVSLDNIVPVIDANVIYGTNSYNYVCEICGLIPKIAV